MTSNVIYLTPNKAAGQPAPGAGHHGGMLDAESASMDNIHIPSIGAPMLDEEHKNVLGFAMFCILTCPHIESRQDCEGCPTGQPAQCKDGLSNVLDYLLPYLEKHFAAEEDVMKQMSLDKTDPMHMAIHLSAHNHLLHRLKAMSVELAASAPDSNMVSKAKNLHDLIMEDFVGHLAKVDQKLLPYLK